MTDASDNTRATNTPFGTKEGLEKLHIMTQKTRFTLIQTILGHPKQLPSVPEIAHLNPNKSKGTVYQHLSHLSENDIVDKHTVPTGERERDLPHKFYGITDEAREILSQHHLLESKEKLHSIYQRAEKSERIKRFEQAPRPQ